MTYDELLQRLLDEAERAFDGEGVGSAVELLTSRRVESGDEFEASLRACSRLDRPWLVYCAALQASIHRLLRDRRVSLDGVDSSAIFSFCASEAGGNHPRAIETAIATRDDGVSLMRGVKRWATLAPVADRLLVIASVGRDDERNRLRAVLVPAEAAGLYVEDMTIPGMRGTGLHLPNGLVQIEDVRVEDEMILPGDGYTDYLKPFRTLEDLFLSASRAAAMLGLARRHGSDGGSDAVAERLVGILGSLHAANADPHCASSQLMIGAAEPALDEQLGVLIEALPDPLASWWRAASDVQVAGTAKARRRATALRRLGVRE